MHDVSVAQQIISRLAVHLGPNVAKMAVADFSKKSLGVKPEAVRPSDMENLLNAMRPMLTVLLGRDHTDAIIQDLGRELPAS